MVYIAPPQAAYGKGGAIKNGNKANRGRGKERDALASKADLLAQLTRQAEEHTRILERERVALGLPGRATPDDQLPPRQDQQQPRRRKNHIYTDQGNKKVFDPRQIPGLGGDGQPAPVPGPEATLNQTFPDSPNFYPGRVFAIPGTIPPPPNQPQQPRPDGGTIIVSPWGGEGIGADVIGAAAQASPPPPHGPRGQPMSPGARGPPLMVPNMGPPGVGMPPGPRGPPMGSPVAGPAPGPGILGRPPSGNYRPPPGGMQGLISPMGGAGPGFMPPPRPGPFLGGGGFGDPVADDPRVAAKLEAEAKKEAYRRELEEQIRAKKMAKEAEERRRREEDAVWEARAAAAPPPWDPEARAMRRGGGGDPIRDEYGRPVANLRMRGPGGSPHGMGPPPGMAPSPFASNPPPGPYPGPPGPAGRLTVEVPSGGFPGSDGPIPILGGPLVPSVLLPPGGFPGSGSVPYDGPPNGHMLSPGSIPPVSPGNRRFMAAMNDLIAGPTEEQRRDKEMARQRLQMDLEEQIREKRERQARERAELERERLKEEAEMKAYYDNLNAQRQGELQRAAPGGQKQQQQQQQFGAAAPGAGGQDGGGPPPLPPRRHGKGKIIDASWLDAVKPPAAVAPLSPQPQGPGGQAQYGRHTGNGGIEDSPDMGPPSGMSPRPGVPMGHGPSGDGAGGAPAGRGTVKTLLHQLQEEQSRIREDFARQAAAMEKLADDAGRALADHDGAWRELQQVKAMLAGGAPPAAGAVPLASPASSPPPPGGVLSGGGGAGGRGGYGASPLDQYASSTVVINTHLVPKSVNAIPDPLPKPVSSEVLRRGLTGPMSHGEVVAGLGGGGGYGAGNDDGGAGGQYGGAFGYEELEELKAHLDRFSGGGFSPGGGMGAGAPRLGRRSGIPLPPGMLPPKAARKSPPRIESVYGLGYGPPPKSRYNGFFGRDPGDRSPLGGNQHSSAGGGVAGGLPSIGPSRRPPPLKPPQSPAILRGDHLPSPVKQARGNDPRAVAGSRVRSGRPGAAGLLERPPRAPRAASALPVLTPKSAANDALPPLPRRGSGSTGGAAAGPANRRGLEDVQKVLRRGHEERLLAGPVALSNDEGSAGGGLLHAYRTQDLRTMGGSAVRAAAAAELAQDGDVGGDSNAAGRGSGRRSRHSREASLPGHSIVLSPGHAADYLRGSGGAVTDDGGGLPPPRPLKSDSVASYRSLLAPLSARGSRVEAQAGEEASGTGPGLRPVGSSASRVQDSQAAVRGGSARGQSAGGVIGGSQDGDARGQGGGGSSSLRRAGSEAGAPDDGGFGSRADRRSGGGSRERAQEPLGGGDSAGSMAARRFSAGGAGVGLDDLPAVGMPIRRPVRVSRRINQSSIQRAVSSGVGGDAGPMEEGVEVVMGEPVSP